MGIHILPGLTGGGCCKMKMTFFTSAVFILATVGTFSEAKTYLIKAQDVPKVQTKYVPKVQTKDVPKGGHKIQAIKMKNGTKLGVDYVLEGDIVETVLPKVLEAMTSKEFTKFLQDSVPAIVPQISKVIKSTTPQLKELIIKAEPIIVKNAKSSGLAKVMLEKIFGHVNKELKKNGGEDYMFEDIAHGIVKSLAKKYLPKVMDALKSNEFVKFVEDTIPELSPFLVEYYKKSKVQFGDMVTELVPTLLDNAKTSGLWNVIMKKINLNDIMKFMTDATKIGK